MDDGWERTPEASIVVLRHAEEYQRGRLIEVVRPVDARAAPVVVLWHGSGPDERDALVPLAASIAARGPRPAARGPVAVAVGRSCLFMGQRTA